MHGSLFEFFRNEALNARNLFAQPGPKPEFRRNQYGLTLGGPIQSNKTFFFTDWQGTRLRTGITRFSVVPTTAQRQGRSLKRYSIPPPRPERSFRTIRSPPTASIRSPARSCSTIRSRTRQGRAITSGPRPSPTIRIRPTSASTATLGKSIASSGATPFFHDDDDPVTPLPDGSGSLTAGVIGHAITRGDALAGDYNWVLSPSALNQFRAGYSRRDLNQTSLQNGGITAPGLPANSFGSVLPIFTVTGLQQIGPTTAANSNFTTSITEFLDTFTLLRGRHTIKFGADIRREALDVLNPPNPTGSFAFTTTGSNSAAVTGKRKCAGLASLGQVNAFTIDIQKQVIQPRAHIAEFSSATTGRFRRGSRSTSAPATHSISLRRKSTIKGPSSIWERRFWTFPIRLAKRNAATSVLASDWRIELAIAG